MRAWEQSILFYIIHLLGFIPSICNGILLDIHLPLKNILNAHSCVYEEAIRWNAAFQKNKNKNRLNNEKNENEFIDFSCLHTPHVTLYLADFDVIESYDDEEGKYEMMELIQAIENAIDEIKEKKLDENMICSMEITDVTIQGAYTMLNIQKNACLQYISDTIVNHTKSFVSFPSSVPDWVYTIPDPKVREEKIELIREYGSPNVFEGFDPHVTVSFERNWDDNDKDRVKARYNKVQRLNHDLPTKCNQTGQFLALGYTSTGGTVVQGPIVDIDLEQIGISMK